MRAHVVTISYLERILIFMAELDNFFPSFNDFLPAARSEVKRNWVWLTFCWLLMNRLSAMKSFVMQAELKLRLEI